MNCLRCGTAALADAKFCPKCGAPLSAAHSIETTASTAIAAETPSVQKPWIRPKFALTLVGVFLLGAYAVAFISAAVRKDWKGEDLLGLMFWTWVFFSYLWKTLGRKPWHGALIGFAVSIGGFFLAAGIAGYVEGSQPEAQLDRNPVLRALKSADPQTYSAVLKLHQEATAHKESEKLLAARANQIIQQAIQRLLPRTSDETLVAYYRTQARYAEILSKSEPELCFEVVYAQTKVAPKNLITDEMLNQQLHARADLILSASTANQQQHADPEILLGQIRSRIKEKFGNKLENFNNPYAANVDRSKVCPESTLFYGDLFQIKTEDAASVIRYLVHSRLDRRRLWADDVAAPP